MEARTWLPKPRALFHDLSVVVHLQVLLTSSSSPKVTQVHLLPEASRCELTFRLTGGF